MPVYGMSRMVATSMGSTTTTAVRLRACCSLREKVYQSGSGASTPDVTGGLLDARGSAQ